MGAPNRQARHGSYIVGIAFHITRCECYRGIVQGLLNRADGVLHRRVQKT